MFGFKIDKGAAGTIAGQLTGQIRDAVLCGKIEAGSRMPPTRTLAKELGVARNTVIQVYEQMIAEGYLCSRTGSGTFAADIGRLPRIQNQPAPAAPPAAAKPEGRNMIRFFAGTPEITPSLRTVWARALKDACLDAGDAAYGYGDPKGHPALTDAIAEYLYRAKDIYCGGGRIYIVPGTAAGLDVIAQLLFREGSCAAVEDPSIAFPRNAIARSGMDLLPVEADEAGMRTDLLPEGANVRLLYVSPSHQYPLGGVLPVGRRLRLLEYAQAYDAYIIEDDYDSEFRYHGEPIQSLWHLGGERTVYLGSFSNMLFPAMRIAYMVVPPRLAGPLSELLNERSVWVGGIEQIALARLLESKQLDRHIYRMKRLYDSKRKELIRCLNAAFGPRMKITGEMAGLHFVAAFERDITKDDALAFAKQGVEPDLVEEYALIKGRNQNKLVLGYGGLSLSQIREGVRRLKSALDGDGTGDSTSLLG